MKKNIKYKGLYIQTERWKSENQENCTDAKQKQIELYFTGKKLKNLASNLSLSFFNFPFGNFFLKDFENSFIFEILKVPCRISARNKKKKALGLGIDSFRGKFITFIF